MPHIVVSISSHGFGHVSQTAPILNFLHERMPRIRLTVRSNVPLSHLHSRIHAPFTHLESEGDIGMAMTSALDVDIEQSRVAYRAFHENWEARVNEEARLLREIGADIVISNVGYLPLAGAQQAGIHNAGLCSLNWADIYRHYCGEDEIASGIQSIYANADVFFRATPGMEMGDLPNLFPVGPIASVGHDRRDELRDYLGLSKHEKLVLVSMGGITSRLPIERWPRIDGVRWLVQQSWQVMHPDVIEIESLPLGFSDLLASSDALVCKPGYGSFVEAACSGMPILFVARPDWPETPALVGWLGRNGVCSEVSRQMLEEGNIAFELERMWSKSYPARVVADGAIRVAECIEEMSSPGMP